MRTGVTNDAQTTSSVKVPTLLERHLPVSRRALNTANRSPRYTFTPARGRLDLRPVRPDAGHHLPGTFDELSPRDEADQPIDDHVRGDGEAHDLDGHWLMALDPVA